MTTEENRSQPVSRFWSKINLVAEITTIFRDTPGQKSVYDKALELIRKVVYFDSATLFLVYYKGHRLEEVTFLGERFRPGSFQNMEITSDFSAWLLKQKAPVHLTRLKDQEQTTDKNAIEYDLVVPLIVVGRLIGAIIFVNQQQGAFLDKDIKLLSIIAGQMALSIERLGYQKRLEESNQALLKAQNELKEYQEEIINDERLTAVRQLAASVNHEINNPLSVITGNVEYLLFINKNLDDNVIERLKIIEGEALRIASVNRRLLEIQSLVSEAYVNDDDQQMLNLAKSSSGRKDD